MHNKLKRYIYFFITKSIYHNYTTNIINRARRYIRFEFIVLFTIISHAIIKREFCLFVL